MASYFPYCHYYVTSSDITKLVTTTGINEIYNVKSYDNSESSLYKLVDDLSEAIMTKRSTMEKSKDKSMFRKSGPQRYF